MELNTPGKQLLMLLDERTITKVDDDKRNPTHTTVWLRRTEPGRARWFCSCGNGTVSWPRGVKGDLR